jgi:hypothetical protein
MSIGFVNEQPFAFDRPAEHGLGPRTLGEGTVARQEAMEQAVDQIRDEVLRHCDPGEFLARRGGPARAATEAPHES